MTVITQSTPGMQAPISFAGMLSLVMTRLDSAAGTGFVNGSLNGGGGGGANATATGNLLTLEAFTSKTALDVTIPSLGGESYLTLSLSGGTVFELPSGKNGADDNHGDGGNFESDGSDNAGIGGLAGFATHYGGNGASASGSDSAGGGGSSAGPGANGNHASTWHGGAAPAGGFAGQDGDPSQADGHGGDGGSANSGHGKAVWTYTLGNPIVSPANGATLNFSAPKTGLITAIQLTEAFSSLTVSGDDSDWFTLAGTADPAVLNLNAAESMPSGTYHATINVPGTSVDITVVVSSGGASRFFFFPAKVIT